MKRIQPPSRSFGGKGTMFKQIYKYFPDNTTYDTYIEAFAGTFSLGLACSNAPIEIFNDLDKNIYSLYKCLSDKSLFEQFKEKCDLTYYSEDLRKEFKQLLKDENITVIDRAFYFFYVNRTSHNGIGGLSVNTVVRRNMSKSVSDMLSAIDRLPELHQRLSKLIVLNTDGVELIKKYDRENVFVYADPPYDWSTRTSARYTVDMDRKAHEEFLDTVIHLKAKILISGYDCPLYDVLCNNGFTKVQFEVNTTSGDRKPKVKIETLWKNY